MKPLLKVSGVEGELFLSLGQSGGLLALLYTKWWQIWFDFMAPILTHVGQNFNDCRKSLAGEPGSGSVLEVII